MAIIPDRGEFIDVLGALARGHLLVQAGQHAGGWRVDGGAVYSAYDTLLEYELVQPVEPPPDAPHLHCYRLSDQGRRFARSAVAAWRKRPLHERLLVRLLG